MHQSAGLAKIKGQIRCLVTRKGAFCSVTGQLQYCSTVAQPKGDQNFTLALNPFNAMTSTHPVKNFFFPMSRKKKCHPALELYFLCSLTIRVYCFPEAYPLTIDKKGKNKLYSAVTHPAPCCCKFYFSVVLDLS